MDKKEIALTLLAAGIVGTMTLFSGVISALFVIPQFQVEYGTQTMRTGCIGIADWKHNATCPNEDEHVKIHIEIINIINSGLKQAKNVEVLIFSPDPTRLIQNDCIESQYDEINSKLIHSLEFERMSKNLDCKITLESLEFNPVSKVVIIADDAPGHTWNQGENAFYTFLTSFIILIAVFIGGLAVLGYIIYQIIKIISIIIKEKELGIPKNIKSYTSDIMFSEPMNDETIQSVRSAEMKATTKRDEWLNIVKTLSITEPEIKPRGIKGSQEINELHLELPEGKAVIEIQGVTKQMYEKLYKTARIKIISEKLEVIENILNKGKHPCWTLYRELYTEFNVEKIIEKIRQETGKNPSGSVSVSKGNEFPIINQADYTIISSNEFNLRIIFAKGTEKRGGSIGIIYDSRIPNKGLFQIKKYLSVSTIFKMAFGEITIPKILEILENASSSKK